jgi:3-phosphoshikimate 1-carboxyvinyltransferase
MTPLWPAPVAEAPVVATVRVPGSKSVTNRALVLAALAAAPTTLVSALRSRDTELMAGGLAALGASVEEQDGAWQVQPRRLCGPAEIDVGNAGTVMRFLLPVAALAHGDVSVDGDPRSRQRPIGPLVDCLRHLGADISGDRALPLTVHGRGWLLGGAVTVDAAMSSQFVSALLLAAPRFADATEIRHVGGPVPSVPHIDLTVSMLRSAGAIVEHVDTMTWRVEPGPLHLGRVVIEPDLSNAAPFLAAAVVTAGTVTVPGWPMRTSQPGDALRALLEQLGATCVLDEHGLTVTGPGRLHGVDVDLSRVGELAPVLAAVCALAEGPSRLRGIAHLRHHETDRLAALEHELRGLGADVSQHDDGISLRPRQLHAGVFATYDDHRLATAAAVIGLRVAGVEVENVDTTGKTLPGFTELWSAMLT